MPELLCPDCENELDVVEYRVEVISRDRWDISASEVEYGQPFHAEPDEEETLDIDRDGATFTCPECGHEGEPEDFLVPEEDPDAARDREPQDWLDDQREGDPFPEDAEDPLAPHDEEARAS